MGVYYVLTKIERNTYVGTTLTLMPPSSFLPPATFPLWTGEYHYVYLAHECKDLMSLCSTNITKNMKLEIYDLLGQ